MKNIFLFILLFVSFLFAASKTIPADSSNNDLSSQSVPGSDVVKFILFDDTRKTGDTLATTEFLLLGPFPLNFGSTNEPAFQYFNLVGGNLPAGDSLSVSYQVVASNLVADTSSLWTECDSIFALRGPAQTVKDISTLSGKYIWFKFYNFTGCNVIVNNNQSVFFRKKHPYTK